MVDVKPLISQVRGRDWGNALNVRTCEWLCRVHNLLLCTDKINRNLAITITLSILLSDVISREFCHRSLIRQSIPGLEHLVCPFRLNHMTHRRQFHCSWSFPEIHLMSCIKHVRFLWNEMEASQGLQVALVSFLPVKNSHTFEHWCLVTMFAAFWACYDTFATKRNR